MTQGGVRKLAIEMRNAVRNPRKFFRARRIRTAIKKTDSRILDAYRELPQEERQQLDTILTKIAPLEKQHSGEHRGLTGSFLLRLADQGGPGQYAIGDRLVKALGLDSRSQEARDIEYWTGRVGIQIRKGFERSVLRRTFHGFFPIKDRKTGVLFKLGPPHHEGMLDLEIHFRGRLLGGIGLGLKENANPTNGIAIVMIQNTRRGNPDYEQAAAAFKDATGDHWPNVGIKQLIQACRQKKIPKLFLANQQFNKWVREAKNRAAILKMYDTIRKKFKFVKTDDSWYYVLNLS